MTILKNVDLENGTVEVTEYSATNAALAMLREKYATVPDANTEEGYSFIKDGIKELTTLRTSLEAARKREKAPYLQAGQIIDAEAKRITEELVKLESPMKAAKKEVDDRLERERQERIARLQQKVDAIKAMPAQVRGKSSEEISAMLDRVGEIDASHDFYDLTKEAVETRQAALDELTQMLTDRLAFEQTERQRIELEAQQAEMQRQREEIERQQQDLAAARQQLAEQDTSAAVEPEAPKAEAASAPIQIKPAAKATQSTDTQWRARVTDKSALIAAIAAGYATEDLLMIDQPALDSLANDKRQALKLPGVVAEPVPAKAA
ncbi:hypothetical protein KUC52_20310 [Pseudomonas aeruginosa]|uniref:hypothetical protein n=1 Tax=Pseudomonas aeruginosa TaxID=287 RepID=UPI0021E1A710|nr:hypothetical protein [Pseudomonas aeruginosa]MCV0331184.1 hypothetical protein [Pseudomonas aeruginosa]